MLFFKTLSQYVIHGREKILYKYSGIDLFSHQLQKINTSFYFFLNLSANKITLISGLVGILGLFFFSNNKYAVLIGSLGYITYYILDYVDGNVARIKNISSINGSF